MPIYESRCPECSRVLEWYAHTHDRPDPACPCGAQTKRVMSAFNVVFTGAITKKYWSRKAEPLKGDGFWTYRTKTESGQPEPVYIETWQQRKDFMKSEGYIGYEDVGPQRPGSDGKWTKGRSAMPGTEI